VTGKTTMGVVFIPWHFVEADANLLANDALDPEAKFPGLKMCAAQVFPARDDELANPDVEVRRGGTNSSSADDEQLTSFGVAADDPYAEVGEEGEDDEEDEWNHRCNSKRELGDFKNLRVL
jgi:hypothetical protein